MEYGAINYDRWSRFTGVVCIVIACLIISTFLVPRFLGIGPGILGLLAYLSACFYLGEKPYVPKLPIVWALVIPAVASLSALWAVDYENAVERALKMSVILVPGVLLLSVSLVGGRCFSGKSMKWISFSVLFLAVAIALELFFDMPIYRRIHELTPDMQGRDFLLNRSTAVLCLLLWPALFVVRYYHVSTERYILYAVFALSLAVIMWMTFSQSAQLATVLAVLFFVSFPYGLKKAWWGLAAFVAVLVFSAPWIATYLYDNFIVIVDNSAWLSSGAGPERIEVWDFVSRKIMENPLYGFGAEATRAITFDTQQLHYPSDTVLHPHNFALQLWIEFGVIGAAMGAAFCAYMIETIRTSFTAQQARYVLPVFIAALSLAATGYGIWQGWLLGLFMLTIAVVVIAVRATSAEDSVKG